MATNPKDVLQLKELQIVDENGVPRILLSTQNGTPSIQMLHSDGTATLHLQVNPQGLPSVQLFNLDQNLPVAKLEIDDKGTHLKFDHGTGASCYLFLNNLARSGLVLIDNQKKRRFNIALTETGELNIQKFDDQGNEVS